MLGEELELDGSGTLIDVGCGPGILAVQLASLFEHVVGIDPDPDMLEEARRHGARSGAPQIEWVRAGAEDVALLDLPPARLVTFGQSFHWTERDRVTRTVYDLLEPGGSIALITHDIDARPAPTGPGDPSIPDEEVQDLIASYLGPDYRTKYRSPHWSADDRYEPALTSSRFGRAAHDLRSRPTRRDPRRGRSRLGLSVHVLRRAGSLRRSARSFPRRAPCTAPGPHDHRPILGLARRDRHHHRDQREVSPDRCGFLIGQAWSGRAISSRSAPWAAPDPARPPPRPLSMYAVPTAMTAPARGPAMYTQ